MVQPFTSGNSSEEMRTLTWKNTCMPMFTAAWLQIGKTWTQPKCPLMNEMDTDNTVCTHTHTHTHTRGILFSHTKKDILLCVATWRDLISIVLREISQRRTNIIWSLFYMESKTKQNKKSPRIPKPSSQIQRTDWWLPQVGSRWDGWRDPKGTTFQS